MEFTKNGRACASRLQFAIEFDDGRRYGRSHGASEEEIRDWLYRHIAWTATGHAMKMDLTEREELELQVFVLDHQEEIAGILSICEEKLRAYVAAGGNPKSMEPMEIGRQALACMEDEGEMYDTGNRVVSKINGDLIPVYQLVPECKN
jgi:hypothetical protein